MNAANPCPLTPPPPCILARTPMALKDKPITPSLYIYDNASLMSQGVEITANNLPLRAQIILELATRSFTCQHTFW